MTIAVATVAFFILPDFPSTTKFLTLEQRVLATKRMALLSFQNGKGGETITSLQAFKMTVVDYRTWVLTVAYMMIAGAGTISYFIPTITQTLGYSGTQAQLYSAIPYAVAFAVSLSGNYSSDHHREKAFHASAFIAFAGIMSVVQAAGISPKASFALLCLVGAGIWTSLPIFLSYATYIMRQPDEKRAVAIAVINSLGNFSSVYGSFLWPKAPYTLGWSVTAAFCFVSAFRPILRQYSISDSTLSRFSSRRYSSCSCDGERAR